MGQKVYNCLIVSGNARGADSLGERYANEMGLETIVKPAQWDLYGKRAGFLRNEEMCDIANALIAFWDGESHGTKHMIDISKRKGIPVRVIKY